MVFSNGDIVFNNVDFAYNSNLENIVLKNVSLKFHGGNMTTLVGHSGAGKSTILNMIPRIYSPHLGNVEIDGQDIATRNLASVRKEISIVDQNTTLFDDTIKNNIRYAK